MVIRMGHVENGVVRLDGGTPLSAGQAVLVIPLTALPGATEPPADLFAEDAHEFAPRRDALKTVPGEKSAADVFREIGPWEGETQGGRRSVPEL